MPGTKKSLKIVEPIQARHQAKNSVYLVVADNTEEFFVALQYAAKMAHANGCHLGVLHVMEPQDFLHWGNIADRMQDELRADADAIFAEVTQRMDKYEGVTVGFYLEEGRRIDALSRVIEDDPNITMLILAGGTHTSNPGPLVSHFTGKGLSKLKVPVLVVPEHLTA